MCLYPKLIMNRKYIANKKNEGDIPPLPLRNFNGKLIPDERVLWVPIGCQKCMECRKKKAREWQVRLLEEVAYNNKALFVTLTFSNENISKIGREIDGKLSGYERDNEIAKIAVRRFLENWRKHTKKSVKHWLITELGHNGTENIHLHGILWTDKDEEFVKNRWRQGFVWTNEKKGVVGGQVVNYIIKYVTKLDEKHKEYKPIILSSPGIGKNYTKKHNFIQNKYKPLQTKEFYQTSTGHKIALPIYFRNKIYNDEEREKLWIEKIEKNERWVDGEKINIRNGLGEYYKVLEEARAKNKRLGYGNNEDNWERKRYEEEQRNLKYEERTREKYQTIQEQIKNTTYKVPTD